MYRHLGFKVISEDDEEFIMAHRLKKNYVYILKCADGTYYTGWTTDPEKRVRVHNSGKGAKYTRPRRPVELIYTEEYWNKTDAQSREYAIKQLPRAKKEKLIKSKRSGKHDKE
jgi:putative endonuclease